MDALRFHNNTSMSLAHAAGTDINSSTGISELAREINVVVDTTNSRDKRRTTLQVENVGYHAGTGQLIVVAPTECPTVRAAAVPLVAAISLAVGSIGTTICWALFGG